ncbi:MAG: hypothetical protein EOM37_05145 [Proteobacteria bacterium]|jgi:hypothetical protein|nr:hypothetical protein [Alphaproteobacteria bacterium]NCC03418.1 hypothetical protein [Pseudomonadota bacterium]
MQFANILLGTPCYGGMVNHVYMESVLQLAAYGASKGMMFSLGLLAHDSLVPRARNTLMAKFLDTPALTHLFFIDSDIAFPAEALGRMLDLDQDIVAGMYPLKVIHWPQVVERASSLPPEAMAQAGLNYVGIPCKGDEREEKNGFITGEYAGTGFMLIKRQAALKMIEAYPDTHYKMAQTYPPPKNPSQNYYNLFDCIVDPETGTYLSEDFTFCHRWRKIGGKIWLDQETKLTHVGSFQFQGDPMTRVGA